MNALRFPLACRFILPQQRCCNCGSIVGRQMLELEAPVPSAGLPDRARRYLVLPLPVCASAGCGQSLNRSPPAWAALLGLGALAGIFAFLLWMSLHSDQPIREIGGMGALLGAIGAGMALGVASRWLRRPQAPQSSAFAPVRIRRLQVARDEVARLEFDFTQADYARDFQLANAEAIGAGKLVARHVSGR